MTRLMEALLSVILYPLAALVYYLSWRPHERKALCDGDLIQWEVKQINGHTVEMIRWIDQPRTEEAIEKWLDDHGYKYYRKH